jgi:hypothetical protein
LGIDLYPTTWLVDRGGTARRVVRGANPNWVGWKGYVDEIAAMPWDGKTVEPAALGWAKGGWAGALDGESGTSARITIALDPAKPGPAGVEASYGPANGQNVPMRAILGGAGKLMLAADQGARGRVRATVKPDGSGGGWVQIGTSHDLRRLALTRPTA